ncbi:MAG: Uncharacterized protein XU09_C0006G0052 [Thaumarchaeota archaeon CSP1-1]|nr:MAG: Uncharacterized protein XU09_C0006G0052 [Thaumarchaeota archaeon CSP1-1]
MEFLLQSSMAMESLEIIADYNRDFYSNCRAYLDALQKQGKTDDSFEDEFYFTMPAVSGIT